MKTLFRILFIENWQRKSISLLVGMIAWLLVNHSLTMTKVISDVPVRIINLPAGKTVEGLQGNGRLSKKLNLTLIGNGDILSRLNANDVEIVIDATGKEGEWNAPISKKNLNSLNPEIDLAKKVSKVYHHSLVMHTIDLMTATIPVSIARPIGEPPRGYQFLDIWPYEVSLTVSGPEDIIKQLQSKEQKITFNLNDITKEQLDALASARSLQNSDVVSFFVPDQWKQIYLPLLSETPLELQDKKENRLRIDFLRCHLLPLDFPIPISLFYPIEYESLYNPSTLQLTSGPLVEEKYHLFFIRPRLYAKGSDRLFTQIIRNRIQITLIAIPQADSPLTWSVVFINPSALEEEYVSTLMTDVSDEHLVSMNPRAKEEYLRNRFRSYMNRFRLFTINDTKFTLDGYIEGNQVVVRPEKPS